MATERAVSTDHLHRLLEELRKGKDDQATRIVQLLQNLRKAFDAHGPATFFVVNTLALRPDDPFRLYSHFHHGQESKQQAEKWAHSLVRQESKVLTVLRKKVKDCGKVGVTHILTRKELISDALWHAWQLGRKLAGKYALSDQLYAWHQSTKSVTHAFAIRGIKRRKFGESDKALLRQLLDRIEESEELCGVLHPSTLPPRLTKRRQIVLELVLLGFSNSEIAARIRSLMATGMWLEDQVWDGKGVDAVEEDVSAILKVFDITRRGELNFAWLKHGGSPAALFALASIYGTPTGPRPIRLADE